MLIIEVSHYPRVGCVMCWEVIVRSYSRPDIRPDQTTQPVLQSAPASDELKVWRWDFDASILGGANMAAYSVIFTIAGWWFGLIDSSRKIFEQNIENISTKHLRAKPAVFRSSAVYRLCEVRPVQIWSLGQTDRETPALQQYQQQ